MADHPQLEIDDNAGGPVGTTAGTPRWVKVAAVIAFVIAVLVVAVLLVGGGNHGPGRHTPDDGADDRPPAATVTASGDTDSHQPPDAVHRP